jgi:hypothetical protein
VEAGIAVYASHRLFVGNIAFDATDREADIGATVAPFAELESLPFIP